MVAVRQYYGSGEGDAHAALHSAPLGFFALDDPPLSLLPHCDCYSLSQRCHCPPFAPLVIPTHQVWANTCPRRGAVPVARAWARARALAAQYQRPT